MMICCNDKVFDSYKTGMKWLHMLMCFVLEDELDFLKYKWHCCCHKTSSNPYMWFHNHLTSVSLREVVHNTNQLQYTLPQL